MPEANEVPTEKVMELKNKNMSNEKITEQLTKEGYSNQQVFDALNQSEIKGNLNQQPAEQAPSEDGMTASAMPEEEAAPAPEAAPTPEEAAAPSPQATSAPQMPAMPQSMPVNRQAEDQIEAMAEEIIDEKWQEFRNAVGDLTLWKDQVRNEIDAIKQEILRTQGRLDTIQSSVMGKVTEYGRGVMDLSSEMKALERVMEKIVEPLASNVKELDRITGALRGKTSEKKVIKK